MTYYDKPLDLILKEFNSNENLGLSDQAVKTNRKKYGINALTKKKEKGLISRIFSALKEPMLIILGFGLVLTLGTNIGKFFKSGEADFTECIGILFAIILSVSITLIMEGNSKRAFDALNKIYDNITVKVLRNGVKVFIPIEHVVVGDILLVESGDKIIADGILIESESLTVDESALTGESMPIKKSARTVLSSLTPLAERSNSVFSGTFVSNGSGKIIVTATGDKTEIGSLAGELKEEELKSPLEEKLSRLGKTITIIGAITAGIVFLISAVRLAILGALDYSSVQDLFISSIILIVAAVPEGLPTIVAVSLALNMVKLAKENALIKKMTASETAGAVSVICTDKTGTLTENKMKVISICKNSNCLTPNKLENEILYQNFVCNSTAELVVKNKTVSYRGSATEGALLLAYQNKNRKLSYEKYRKSFKVLEREPFSSEKKFMTTTIEVLGEKRVLLKGAPEKVLSLCDLTKKQVEKILQEISAHQKQSKRVICFAHRDIETKNEKVLFIYDGFAVIADPIRKEVYKAVNDCFKAGIKIKILTGDNFETALAIAKELKIATSDSQVINSKEIENMSESQLSKALEKITVIARSTPSIKLKVVKALKSAGEVVAVTGDGINDAPAIKHADIGISMGINGSDITKESADIVLLNDSFSTVVKAVSFGRSVYKNLQRFIVFQLSVNLSALLFVTVSAIIGMPQPFNTLQLLWINLIMDGPPAITLGLDTDSSDLMNNKPIKKSSGIVSKNMLLRIIFNGLFVGTIMVLEYAFDFLRVGANQMKGTVFTLFILFQLFNAFNSKELGVRSIFSGISKNKIMSITFLGVFLVHFIIVQFFPIIFGVTALTLSAWIKTIITASSMIVITEISKILYKTIYKREKKKSV